MLYRECLLVIKVYKYVSPSLNFCFTNRQTLRNMKTPLVYAVLLAFVIGIYPAAACFGALFSVVHGLIDVKKKLLLGGLLGGGSSGGSGSCSSGNCGSTPSCSGDDCGPAPSGAMGGSGGCAVNTIIKCGTDIEISARDDNEKRTLGLFPKAILAISDVTKYANGFYEVMCNFQMDKYNEIINLIPISMISSLTFTGTGTMDYPLIQGDDTNIENWAQWSTPIVVKPEIINGKCCLPRSLALNIDMNLDSASGWKEVFPMQFAWKNQGSTDSCKVLTSAGQLMGSSSHK